MSTGHDRLKISQFFDKVSGLYDPWFQKDVHYLEMLEAIVDDLEGYDRRRIVELGCGSGNLTVLLAERFPTAEIIAVDVSTELLSIARKKCEGKNNVAFVNDNMLSFMSKLEKPASVVGNLSLHHLTDTEKRRLTNRVSRAIAGGDAFIIGDVFVTPSASVTREQAVLNTFHARCSYYLSTVGIDRAIFELEHVPLILKRRQEHLVGEDFWRECAADEKLRQVKSRIVGPGNLGNMIIEITQ